MLTTFSDIPERDRVIVALDCDIEEAFELADKLQGKATWMKIGMTLFYANGPRGGVCAERARLQGVFGP